LNIFGAMWEKDRSFTILLLILLVYIFVVIPFVPETRLGGIASSAFFLLLLSSGFITVLEGKTTFIVSILALPVCLFGLTVFILKGTRLTIALDLFHVAYCIALAGIILVKTFAGGEMSIRRIEGAIGGYLLIGLIFSLVYHAIFKAIGQTAFNGLQGYGRNEFMYFSITTLTTVGYGDITPVAASARSLSNLEAIIGQLYPAILIARLVSLQIIYDTRE